MTLIFAHWGPIAISVLLYRYLSACQKQDMNISTFGYSLAAFMMVLGVKFHRVSTKKDAGHHKRMLAHPKGHGYILASVLLLFISIIVLLMLLVLAYSTEL